MVLLTFLKRARQSSAKRGNFTLSSISFLRKYETKLTKGWGKLVSDLITRLITQSKNLNGLSRTSFYTILGFLTVKLIAETAPMLRPQTVRRSIFINLQASLSTNSASEASFTPQVRQPGSLLPQPTKSNEMRATPCSTTKGSTPRIQILVPPLPCRQSTASRITTFFSLTMSALMFLPSSLTTWKSSLSIRCVSISCSLGRTEFMLYEYLLGAITLFHPRSKLSFSASIITINVKLRYNFICQRSNAVIFLYRSYEGPADNPSKHYHSAAQYPPTLCSSISPLLSAGLYPCSRLRLA